MISLHQGDRSVSDYSIKFQTLVASCSYNAVAQWDQFLHGLADEIQDEASAHELPTLFDDLVDLATRVDNQVALCRRNWTARLAWAPGGTQVPSLTPCPESLPEPDTMQVGRT